MAQDVSSAGVKLVLRRPFDEGTKLIVTLEGSGRDQQRSLLGVVVHVVESAPGIWELGCIFERVVDDDALQELLLGGLKKQSASLMSEPWEST